MRHGYRRKNIIYTLWVKRMTEEKFKFVRIREYPQLKQKVRLLLSENKHVDNFEYFGGEYKEQKGILVIGTDSKGIQGFKKFFPTVEINRLFTNWCKRVGDL